MTERRKSKEKIANSDYHVIILAAGCSRRLAEFTKSIPKPFLPIASKRLIEYSLDSLHERGFSRVTFVVGYLQDVFQNTLKSQYKNLKLDYVISKDYATTGHGWSIFLTKDSWEKEKKPVLLLHGDILYHPEILDKVLLHHAENVMAVDNLYQIHTGDEVIVTGNYGMASGFAFGIDRSTADAAGELIGVNKWSANFMGDLYSLMDQFFTANGNNFNYEPVLDKFLRSGAVKCSYVPCGGLKWVNINYPEDYRKAQEDILRR